MESIYYAYQIDVCNQLDRDCLSKNAWNTVGILNANMHHEGMQMNHQD